MRAPIGVIGERIRGGTPDKDFRFTEFDVTPSLAEVRYADLDVRDQHAVAVQQSLFTNDTDGADTRTFTVDETTTDSFSWTLSEAPKVGTKFKVAVPFTGDNEVTAELNLAPTRSRTTSVTRHRGYSTQIQVPAHSRVQATFSVLEGKITTPFTAVLQIRGYIDIAWRDGHSWNHCFGQIARMLDERYCVSDPAVFQCTASGQQVGTAAATYVVHTRDLDDGSTRQLYPTGSERSEVLVP